MPVAGKTAQFGGAEVRWKRTTAEDVLFPEIAPAFKGVVLNACELQAYVKVTNALHADAAALVRLMPGLLAGAVAWAEDYAFLRGTGAGEPLGVLGWDGLIAVTRSGASAFALADVAGMLARFLVPRRREDACWVMHPSVLVKMVAMTGGANVLHCVVDPVTGRVKYLLAGYEVCVMEKLPGLNTLGDVLLLDRSMYLIGDRILEVAFSPHVLMTHRQSVWRVVARGGAAVVARGRDAGRRDDDGVAGGGVGGVRFRGGEAGRQGDEERPVGSGGVRGGLVRFRGANELDGVGGPSL